MNEKLKDAFDNIYDARLPNLWKRGSWESSTLGFWFTELLERDKQFRTWCFEVRIFSNLLSPVIANFFYLLNIAYRADRLYFGCLASSTRKVS